MVGPAPDCGRGAGGSCSSCCEGGHGARGPRHPSCRTGAARAGRGRARAAGAGAAARSSLCVSETCLQVLGRSTYVTVASKGVSQCRYTCLHVCQGGVHDSRWAGVPARVQGPHRGWQQLRGEQVGWRGEGEAEAGPHPQPPPAGVPEVVRHQAAEHQQTLHRSMSRVTQHNLLPTWTLIVLFLSLAPTNNEASRYNAGMAVQWRAGLDSNPTASCQQHKHRTHALYFSLFTVFTHLQMQ